MKKIAFLFFVFFIAILKAQTVKNKDSVEFYKLIKQSWSLKDNFKEASKIVKKARKIAFKKPDSLWVAQSFYYEAIFNYLSGGYKKTLQKSDTAEIWYPSNNYYGKASTHNLKGLVYTNTDNIVDAIKEYQMSLSFAKNTDNLHAISNPNHNIGILYQNLKQFDEAKKYFLKALKVRYQIKDSTIIYQSYLSVGGIYNLLKVKDSAMIYLRKIINPSNEKADLRTKAFAYNNIGLVYKSEENYKKAIDNYNIAISLHQKLNNDLGFAESYKNLAEAYQKLENYKKSIEFAKKTIFYGKKIKTREEIVDAYEIMAENYGFLNKKDSALYFYNQFVLQKDSLIDESKAKKFAELQVKYDFKEKETELLQTRTEKAETELQLSKTRTWTFVLIGSLAVLLFMGMALFQRNKRKHQLAIANQKEKNLEAILFAEEKERSRIARELHDGVVQQIGSIILKTRALFSKHQIAENDDSQKVLKTLENSNQDIRNISHQMMPRALSELGLVSAIDDLLKGSLEYVNIDYSFEHFNLKERLSEKIEITLYRITQELINNIIKHSKATSVSIQLINSNENILLIIEDDGVGIDSTKTKKGIGFSNIKSRLALINGEANFDKSLEKGTLVTVKIKK